MFDFLKKKQCSNCGKISRKIVVNYAGYDICSEECMIEFFSIKAIFISNSSFVILISFAV